MRPQPLRPFGGRLSWPSYTCLPTSLCLQAPQVADRISELTDRCLGLTLVSGITVLRSMFSGGVLITSGVPTSSFLHGIKVSCFDVPEPNPPALAVSGAWGVLRWTECRSVRAWGANVGGSSSLVVASATQLDSVSETRYAAVCIQHACREPT